MTSDHAFGSDELTPDMLRNAAFAEEDGRVDAAEVRIFLDRVASSLEVFMSSDATTALRAEFDRNVSLARQILDAGQTASEQLRRQAAEEAKRILDEARDATLGLRETVEVEIEQARTQVEAMRGTFIQDLRDLYDRIGASLYRFERAAEESAVAPIQEPSRAEPPRAEPPRAEPPRAEPAPLTSDDRPSLPEGAKAPAWQQLPPEAWQATASGDDPGLGIDAPESFDTTDAPTPDDLGLEAPAPAPESLAAEVPAEVAPPAEHAPQADPFAPVVEDEPLAPGEPLVDLRSFGSAVDEASTVDMPAAGAPAEPANVTEDGGSWLDPVGELPPVAPQAEATAAPAPEPTPVDTGSWLEAPLDPDPAAGAPADPALARDDALAQALIGSDPIDTDAPPAADGAPAVGTPAPDVAVAPEAAAPAPGAAPPPPFPTAGASPDAVAVRQLILDSLAAGQTRETVESYLREHMGLLEPGALVDAALTTAEQQ